MSEKTVRKIFIVILIFLPLQYILVGVVGYYKTEPWPAFVFPGFKNVYFEKNTFQISQTYFELYDSSNELIDVMQAYKFLPDIPRSQISGFMNTHFLDSTQVEQFSFEAKKWLKTNSSKLTERQVESIKIVRTTEYYHRLNGELKIDSAKKEFAVLIGLQE